MIPEKLIKVFNLYVPVILVSINIERILSIFKLDKVFTTLFLYIEVIKLDITPCELIRYFVSHNVLSPSGLQFVDMKEGLFLENVHTAFLRGLADWRETLISLFFIDHLPYILIKVKLASPVQLIQVLFI